MPHRSSLTLATLFVAATPTLALAVDSPSSSHPCASIVDNSARLACYDRAFGQPSGAAAAAPVTTAAAAAPVKAAAAAPVTTAAAAPLTTTAVASATAVDPAVKARDEFGLSQPHKRALEASEGNAAPDSITKTVTSVSHTPAGESVVHLDGGQVWIEVTAYSGVSIKQGDVVTIRKASLGSFMLVTPRHTATRVRRLE